MANRRMFALSVIDTDKFLEMPMSTQLLYFHLGMRADDEGFVDRPRSIMRLIGSNDDDLRILIAHDFVTPFNDGVIILNHWNINNQMRSDRMVKSRYHDRLAQLIRLPDGSITTHDRDPELNNEYKSCQPTANHVTTNCQPRDNQLPTKCQPSIGKDSIGQYSIVKDSIGQYRKEIYSQAKSEKTESVKNKSAKENTPKKKKEPDALSPDVYEVVQYLNEKAGKHYVATSKSTSKFITARLKDGATVDEMKAVIDRKCAQWKDDPKMNMYLRPKTLFNETDYESYRNESDQIASNSYMDLYEKMGGDESDNESGSYGSDFGGIGLWEYESD